MRIKVEDNKDDNIETESPEVASELISATDYGEVADEAEGFREQEAIVERNFLENSNDRLDKKIVEVQTEE